MHCACVRVYDQVESLRMMLVKNPWARSPWKGHFASSDRHSWTPELKRALNVTDTDLEEMDKRGIFWMEFSDCRLYYRSFFLNCKTTVPRRRPPYCL